jgi:hypothetical protein
MTIEPPAPFAGPSALHLTDNEKGRPDGRPLPTRASHPRRQAEKLLPHPQPPVAFGFLNVNPEPCMDVT